MTNAASWPRSLNFYELAGREWFAGVNLRVVCDLQPGEDPVRRSTGSQRTQPVSESKASACVDMLWPNAPSSVRQAHIRRAMGRKTRGGPLPDAPAAARVAEYLTGGPHYPVGPARPTSGGNIPGSVITIIAAIYAGSPTDSGVLDPSASGMCPASSHCKLGWTQLKNSS